MGARGPVPKPSAQRRRTNKPALPVATAPRAAKAVKAVKSTRAKKAKAVEAPVAVIPKADPTWHPVALGLFESLGRSGQSAFYEASDWAVAVLICESISRDLRPQFVGYTEKGDVITESIPMKGASMAAVLKGLSSLLVTEGDRRRVQVELQRGMSVDPDAERALATVTELHALVTG